MTSQCSALGVIDGCCNTGLLGGSGNGTEKGQQQQPGKRRAEAGRRAGRPGPTERAGGAMRLRFKHQSLPMRSGRERFHLITVNRYERLVPTGFDRAQRLLQPVRGVSIAHNGFFSLCAVVLLAQRESEKGVTGGDSHILTLVNGVSHRPRIDRSAKTCAPEFGAGAGIESPEVSFAASGK
jgi:hypothetical protein